MERTINEEEKIRRAEEIYYRRRNLNNRAEEYTTLNISSADPVQQTNSCSFSETRVEILLKYMIQNENILIIDKNKKSILEAITNKLFE